MIFAILALDKILISSIIGSFVAARVLEARVSDSAGRTRSFEKTKSLAVSRAAAKKKKR